MRLLIADDEDYAREGLIESIPWEKYGIDEIMQAKDGREALTISGWFRPDIVLTDIRMPKLNGLEFAERLIRQCPDSKLLFMSGYMEIEYLKKAISLDAVEFVEKPIELDKVEQTIMMQQAMDKKLENLERRRQELFTAHGLDGRTLKQIADEAKDSERKVLLELYRRIDGSIGNIQYYNKKAETVAKSELERMGIDSRMVGNPTGIYGRPSVQKGSKLEKKA